MGVGMPTPSGDLLAKALPSSGAPMFPTGFADGGTEPLREQTVMKQAAELLEEALKEAGGSLEEIGQNPLFKKPAEFELPSPSAPRKEPHLSPTAYEAPGVASPPGEPLTVSQPPAPFGIAADGPRNLRDSLAKPPGKTGNFGRYAGLLLVLSAGAGGVFAWQSGAFDSGGTSPPNVTPPASAASAAAPLPPTASSAPPIRGSDVVDASGPSATAEAGVGAAIVDAGVPDARAEARKPAPAFKAPPRPKPPAPPPAAASASDAPAAPSVTPPVGDPPTGATTVVPSPAPVSTPAKEPSEP